MSRRPDKRVRLVSAANTLIHQQGFNLTTLADIAQDADVPLGNVYYYFKTKEAIGESVIEGMNKELKEQLLLWEQNPDPVSRLMALVQHEADNAELTARSGCPIGGLCQELAKQGGTLADLAAKLLSDISQWCEKQFRALGSGERASEFSLQFLSMLQGTSVLTCTFKDPKLVIRTSAMINQWLCDLQSTVKQTEAALEEVAA